MLTNVLRHSGPFLTHQSVENTFCEIMLDFILA